MKTNPVEEQFAIRLFRREGDVAGFVRLRAEIEAFDQAGNDTSEAAAISTLNWPGHDPMIVAVETPASAARLAGTPGQGTIAERMACMRRSTRTGGAKGWGERCWSAPPNARSKPGPRMSLPGRM
jgi:hypothetical protein